MGTKASKTTKDVAEKTTIVEEMTTFVEENTTVVEEKTTVKHRRFLEERIDPDTGLLDILLGNETLSMREFILIKKSSTFIDRNSELLNFILAEHQCDRLFTALRETEQIHIVNYLKENGVYKTEIGGDWPLTEKEVSILNTNHGSLVDLLECDELHGLLFSLKVINKRQRDSISSKPTSHEKNEALLECLQRRSLRDYYQTIKCLRQTKQSHIAEILEAGGAIVRVHANLEGENVTRIENEISTKIAEMLSDRSIDEANRILELVNLKVIAAKTGQSIVLYIYCKTIEDLQQLRKSMTSGRLKDSVQLCFNHPFNRQQRITVAALKVSTVEFQKMQTYFKGEEIRRQDLRERHSGYFEATEQHSEPKESVTDYVKLRATVDSYSNRLSCREADELETFLELQRAKSNAAQLEDEDRRSTSSDLYNSFDGDPYLKTLEFERGDKMKTIAPANIGDSVAWWMVRHIDSGWFGLVPRNRVVIDSTAEDQPVKTTINMLPMELLDIILQKSFLHFALSGKQSTGKRDEFIVSRLSSVDFCWFQRLRKHRFKKTIMRHLSKFYEEFDRGIAIFMSNRLYLEENIQLKVLISRLRSADCLTDVETRLLSRKTLIQSTKKLFRNNNNPDLLHLMRSFDDAKLSDFIRCLRKSNQKLISRVAGIRGVFLKAIVLNQETSKRQSLDQRIDDLQDETEPKSHQLEKLISQLKDNNIEIFNSVVDRQTIVWIWCQSQTHLEKIQKLNESIMLMGEFTGLKPPSLSAETAKPKAVSICRGKLRYKSDPVFVQMIRTKAAEESKKGICGLAILDSELFVVSEESKDKGVWGVVNDVEVYDLMKFSFNRQWKLKELFQPMDMGSCNRNKCLYIINDSSRYGHWSQILRVDSNGKLIKKWSTATEYTPGLSVTDESNIILSINNKLQEYSPDGQLIREINLSPFAGIHYTSHAVKLTNGHFVVCDLHSVCIVDADGELKKSFGGSGSIIGQMNRPSYLAIDGNGFVMVVDRGYSRVLLLDPDLEFKREILSEEKHGLQHPSRILLDESNNRLLVVDNQWGYAYGEISIFQFDIILSKM